MREGNWGEKRERFEAEIRRVFFHIRLEENRLEVRLRSLRTTTLYSIASTYILFLVVQETVFPIFLRKTQHEHQNVNDESYPTTIIIGDLSNNQFDTLWLSGGNSHTNHSDMTKGTSPESWTPRLGNRVYLRLIDLIPFFWRLLENKTISWHFFQ